MAAKRQQVFQVKDNSVYKYLCVKLFYKTLKHADPLPQAPKYKLATTCTTVIPKVITRVRGNCRQQICPRRSMLVSNYWVAAREVPTQRCVGITCSKLMQNKSSNGQELSYNLCQEEANMCQPSKGQVKYCGERGKQHLHMAWTA